MGEHFTRNRHLNPLELGDVTEGDLSVLVAQWDDHFRIRAVIRLPVPHPPLQCHLKWKPVHILLPPLQVLQQRDRRQRR